MAGRTRTHRRARRRVVAAAALLVPSVTACAAGDRDADDERVTLTVLAAASLTETFPELAEQFEAAHPGVTVQLGFGGSADLAAQVLAGAPADVFASADVRTMDALGGSARSPRPFASNTLQIAVPPGNPARIRDLADLGRSDVRLVTCAPEVPCGRVAEAVARTADVELDPVSREQSVTDVLGKVATGEADAGLVYVTDVVAADGSVEGVAVPEAAGVTTTYPIAVLDRTNHPELAEELVELVLSRAGQQVLRDAGFGAP